MDSCLECSDTGANAWFVAGYGCQKTIGVPGVTCRTNDSNSDGKAHIRPLTDGCNQMHFFANLEAAETWVKDYPGVVVFNVEDAFQLARANWIERRNEVQAVPTPIEGDNPCCC